jgi:hypothetical protein
MEGGIVYFFSNVMDARRLGRLLAEMSGLASAHTLATTMGYVSRAVVSLWSSIVLLCGVRSKFGSLRNSFDARISDDHDEQKNELQCASLLLVHREGSSTHVSPKFVGLVIWICKS